MSSAPRVLSRTLDNGEPVKYKMDETSRMITIFNEGSLSGRSRKTTKLRKLDSTEAAAGAEGSDRLPAHLRRARDRGRPDRRLRGAV